MSVVTRTIPYTLCLDEPALLLSPSGRRTTGAGGGLDFVPGSTLLGALATRYGVFHADDAWTLFHSGAIRFGDARIAANAQGEQATHIGDAAGPSRPAPFAYHREKGETLEKPHWLDDSWYDLTRVTGADRSRRRFELYRAHLARVGSVLEVKHEAALKTAVEYHAGRASDGQLFEEHVLPAGMVLQGWIEVDGPHTSEAQRLVDMFRTEMPSRIRVGKRRQAGRGKATLTLHDEALYKAWAWPDAPDPFDDGRVSLWLLSDLCLFNPNTHQPTLEPTREHFDLPETAAIDWHRCFVRSVRWTPYNGHRRRPDPERLALKAGSVLTFSGLTRTDLKNLRARAQRGFGAYRFEGLGRIHVQPAMLAPQASDGMDAQGAPVATPVWKGLLQRPLKWGTESSTGEHGPALQLQKDQFGASFEPFRKWLQGQAEEARLVYGARELAEDGFDTLKRFAKRGPKATQWNVVAGVANAHRHLENRVGYEAMRLTLFAEADMDKRHQRGILRRGALAQVWYPKGRAGAGNALDKWMKNQLADAEAHAAVALGLLANRMAKQATRARETQG